VLGGVQKFDSAVAGRNVSRDQIVGGAPTFGIEYKNMGVGPKKFPRIEICDS
jgi:hypothetical protein